jgi:hypothetical protein
MAGLPVEGIFAIYYGPTAHRAVYGRLEGTKYTKDYVQLSRKSEFMDLVTSIFPVDTSEASSIPLTFKWWPTEAAPGELVFLSADRPHLKWDFSQAPKAWKMTPNPSDTTAETIPGNPSHQNEAAAENEFSLLQSSGAGQPYLMAVKLRDEPRTLHLRAYLDKPSEKYAWADVHRLPESVQALIARTTQSSALAWCAIQSGGVAPSEKVSAALLKLSASNNIASEVEAFGADTGRELVAYLQNPAYGLFFDPTRNHDAWKQAASLPAQVGANAESLLKILNEKYPATSLGDAAAETADTSAAEITIFREQIEQKNYEVPDSHTTTKTRGSAQRAFAEAVKANYGSQCAITGIKNRNFLVAAHIVPWSVDQTIRLDPCNGICLSLIVDRAFENGHLIIEDDLTIRVDWERLGDDEALKKNLQPYDGKRLNVPALGKPKLEYLQRRRALVN